MDVEAMAVSEINRVIARCPRLKAFIAMNDKTPFTDGHIDLYRGLRQTNEDWTGRVPVQVKGRSRSKGTKRQPTHPISRTDLLAYQKDSGVLYFVVTVDPKTASCTPYYALLSPFRIDTILRAVPRSRRQVSVSIRRVPTDVDGLEGLLELALKTRDQNASLGFDPILFKQAESITVHAATDLNLDAPLVLDPGITDFALVLNTSEGLSIPLDGTLHLFPKDYLEREVAVRTSSGDIVYDTATVRRVDDDVYEARISEGLKLTFRNEDGKISTKVDLSLERTLAGRLKALRFFTAVLDTGAITIGGQRSSIEITRKTEDAWLRKHLAGLTSLTELLDRLGVDTRLIEPDEISEDQAQQLRLLHRAFVEGHELTDATGTTSRILQHVGRWKILFLRSPGSSPDKWRCVDPFSVDNHQQFRWSASEDDGIDEAIPVTAYDIVDDEHLEATLNMRLEAIVGSYEAIADFPSTFTVANQRVLALIAAADASTQRQDELLNAAARLNDWLLANDEGQDHHHINRWQIVARRHELSPEQRYEVRDLKRRVARNGADNALQAEVACALVLGDTEEVEFLLARLSTTQRQQLQGWPIWKLRREPDRSDDNGR